jgi:hypothetical protein
MKVKPVTKTNWNDFERLFKSKGAPHYCWCMAWRLSAEERKRDNSASRKKYMKQRISTGTPVGLLGYIDDDPVAWCSIAPRDSYQRLGGDEDLEQVWSIVCFFIKKEFRDQGFIDLLIHQAKKFAKQNGGKYLEGYPVDPKSPSYRFMGFVQTFKKAGFHFVKKAGTRRNVMIYKL